MYFLVFRYLQTGGVETLTLREGEWFKRNRGDVCVITQVISDDMKGLYRKNNVEVIVLDKWNAKRIHDVIISKQQKIDLIHMYDLGDFLRYKSRYPKHDVKIIYYCVHPLADCYFKSAKIGKKIFIGIISKAIAKFNNNKNIIYMDEDTLTSNLNHYGLENDRERFTIMPLPYRIQTHSIHQKSNAVFRILTVSRADFPYKGYLIGLIDELNNRYNDLPEFNLTIISRGDINVIKNKIESLNINVQNHITLIDGVSPEKLSEYYFVSDLYVGMGTTVLEAADYGVPSVIACYNTYELISVGRFDERPLDLGSNHGNGDSGIDDVISIANLTAAEYEKLQAKTIRVLRENYDEDKILNDLDTWECNNLEKLSILDNMFLRLYFTIRDLVFG